MQQYITEFAIIGGGIAGLSAANALQQTGITALVFEAAPAFAPVGAGLTLAANAIQALDRLHLSAAVMEKGAQVHQLRICSGRGKVLSKVNMLPHDSQYPLQMIAIHRAQLHDILLSGINTDAAITGKRTVACTHTTAGYQISFADGSGCLAQAVIVADGIHSPIRSQLLPGVKPRYAGYTCWRGIATNSGIRLDGATETWGAGCRFGMVPVNDTDIYWYACINTTPGNKTLQQFSITDIADRFSRFHDPVVQVILATAPGHMVWGDICDLAPLKRFAFDQLVLIGDAAHATTPNLGQGACMAIEDAVILADELKRNSNVAHAFRSFEQRRIQRTTHIVNESWRMGRIAQMDQPVPVFLRNLLLSMLPSKLSQQRMKAIVAADHWYK